MNKEPELKPVAEAAPKKKGKLGLIIGIAVGVLVLAGGGAAAYWKFKPAPPAAEGAEAQAAAKASEKVPTGVVAFEPFLVNLAGGNGQAYLRTTLNLLVDTELEAKEIGESAVVKARMRSAIIEVLAQQSGETLVTAEGKEVLKKALLKQLQALKQKAEVHDVLFAEFVVQF